MNNDGRYIPDEIPKTFWNIIEQCHADTDVLKTILETMSAEKIIAFYWNYEEAVAQIKPFYYDLTEFSEDSIDELCYWVVAQGESIYTRLWDDPDSAILNPKSPMAQLRSDPGLVSETMTVYEERFKKALPDKQHENFVE